MALNATRLAGRKATDDTWITLVNPNCVEKDMLALVDTEWMLIGNTIGSLIGTTPPRPTVGVVPGYDGSTAGPHAQNAPAIVGRPYDFTSIGLIPGGIVTSQSFSDQWSYLTGPLGLAGTTPTADTVVYLTNPAGSNNYQLSPPTADQQNTLTIVNVTGGVASLHYVAGFGGNTASVIANFPLGSLLTLKAQNGSWVPVAIANGGVNIP